MEELKGYWVIFSIRTGRPDYSTISFLRKDAIKKLLENTEIQWSEVKDVWRVAKVNITFEEVKKK